MNDTCALSTFLHGHEAQLQLSGVPKIFWPSLWRKLKDEIFDAGEVFQLASVDYGPERRKPKDPVWKLFVMSENGLLCNDSNNIYLIDHAWTYDAANARKNLSEVPGLLDRMASLMGYEDLSNDGKIEFVLSEMWRYNQSFALSSGTVEERMPLWYIMDELGSAINHSDEPNFRIVPFLYLSQGITYTLLFPVKNACNGDEVTRNFVEGESNDLEKREALLLPWIENDFSNESFVQSEPSESYFLSGHVRETLPIDRAPVTRHVDSKLKVYSEYRYVNEYLNDPAFEIVDEIEEADVLWLMSHYKDYEDLSVKSPHKFVNQFPFENVLTIKDLLAIVCRRKAPEEKYDPSSLETYPTWIPTTYNLSTELRQFVAYFQQRKINDLDNHWICKPWNLARGLDTHVTNNLNQILRLPLSGPKIAQKYVDKPVLYERPEIGRVKFDVRYVVLLKSTDPLQAYAYSNFFLRFANREFALENLDCYEQHFTVMNYSENANLCHVKCEDFIVEWNKMYVDHDWRTKIEPEILKILRYVFEAATEVKPPRGIAKSPQSRALYAVDMMLEWRNDDIQPLVLEVNFSPDNKRACEYYPNFYNDVFKCLFLDVNNEDVFHDLCKDSLNTSTVER